MDTRNRKGTHKAWMVLAIILTMVVSFIIIGGCSKKKIRSDYPSLERSGDQSSSDTESRGTGEDTKDGGSSVSEQGLDSSASQDQADEQSSQARVAREKFENDDVFFEFDSAALLPEAQSLLMEKADWLRNHPGVNVVIEGHTDERGTIAYNLALGDRRAESVRAFLMELGVDTGRIRTVSYGEENPIDSGQNEASWAKNRRAHFFIE